MVSRADLASGRTQQKQRTRNALLEAVVRLVSRGDRPRLAAVAREAMVSRATAYRYFPSEEALVVEASLVREFRSASEVLPDDAPADPASRAVTVQRYLFDHARAHEVEFRAFLRATFEQWLSARGEPEAPLRAGRRMEMFARALAPVQADVGTDTARRLELALSMMSGVESLIAARDVCRIDPDEARDIMAWAVQTLVRAVLAGEPTHRDIVPARPGRDPQR